MGISCASGLRLERVSKSFNQGIQTISVLCEITVSFDANKTYALTGVSGSGKSTLIHLLAGLEEPTDGTVYFNSQSINTLNTTQKQMFLNKAVGLIFQAPHLLKELSVLENVMIKKLITGSVDTQAVNFAHDLLALVNLADRAHTQPLLLSGGEQQRVAIARALFINPAFLLADEPTAHVDEKNRDTIIELLLNCQKQTGTGLIIASHDLAISQAMATHYRLQNKKIEIII